MLVRKTGATSEESRAAPQYWILAICGFPPRDSRPFVLLSRLESPFTFRDARFVDPKFSVIQYSKYPIEPRDMLLQF
jgi:hypothetical protein